MAQFAVDEMNGGGDQAAERRLAVLCYLWAFLGPLMILPLVFRWRNRSESRFLDSVTSQVLNLQILFVAALIATSITALVSPAGVQAVIVILFLVCVVYCDVLGVVGAVHAWRGEVFRYPVNLHVVREVRREAA